MNSECKVGRKIFLAQMYPNNNELVKMGTFVIITKIIHRYSDYSTAEESGLCRTDFFGHIGGSKLDPKVYSLM